MAPRRQARSSRVSGCLVSMLLLLLAAGTHAAPVLGRRGLLQFGSNPWGQQGFNNNNNNNAGGGWGSQNSNGNGWGGQNAGSLRPWGGSGSGSFPGGSSGFPGANSNNNWGNMGGFGGNSGGNSGSTSSSGGFLRPTQPQVQPQPQVQQRPQVPPAAAAPQLSVNRNKGDLNSLSSFISPAQGLRSRPRQAIAAPTSGPANNLYLSLRRGNNAQATAQTLANTFSSDSEAAATAVASAATTSSGSEATAVAEAVAKTTVNHPGIAPTLLAKSADLAVNRGQTDAFAHTMADAFTVARRDSVMPQFTRSVAGAVSQGGPSARLAYGEAIATAIASGGDSQAAVAEATATAFCEGGSTAQSWASAYAIALGKDSKGCLVLNQAKAMAQAKCGAGVAESISKAEATSVVLGFCGLADLIPGYSFNSGNAGGNSWSG